VGEETTFILLQRFLTRLSLPIWAQGGIGLRTAAACYAAGAAGVVLDSQLYLTRESPLPESVRSRIAAMDGSETVCLGQELGESYRVYTRPGMSAVESVREDERRLAGRGLPRRLHLRRPWQSGSATWQACWGESERRSAPIGRLHTPFAPLARTLL